MSSLDAKAAIRSEYKQRLNAFDFFSLIDKSSKLSEHFFTWTQQNASHLQNKAVISFCPFGNEPQLNIEVESKSEPYQVAYVRVQDWKQGKMEAHYARRDLPGMWEEIGSSDETKFFQPDASQPICPPEKTAAILIPGLAFTRDGHRLGRGAGFYDRFLTRYPEALRIGVAFEEQITNHLPVDAWDISLDLLMTDSQIYSMKSYGEWKKHGKLRAKG
jgi:5,10-methenyltetrahydrofolate synthetase